MLSFSFTEIMARSLPETCTQGSLPYSYIGHPKSCQTFAFWHWPYIPLSHQYKLIDIIEKYKGIHKIHTNKYCREKPQWLQKYSIVLHGKIIPIKGEVKSFPEAAEVTSNTEHLTLDLQCGFFFLQFSFSLACPERFTSMTLPSRAAVQAHRKALKKNSQHPESSWLHTTTRMKKRYHK